MRKFLNIKSCLFFSVLISFEVSFCQTNLTNSALAEGDWYKVKVSNTGLYKVSYDYLVSIGFPTSNLGSDEIKLFGNSTGLLPFKNSIYRPNDILENSLIMQDGGDGKFGPGDYFLFYAKGPDTWNYSASGKRFLHTKHFYDDYSYFFLTRNNNAPKRTQNYSGPTGSEVATVTEFSDFKFYEKDLENLIKSGRTLYGEKFDFVDKYSFDFAFADLAPNKPASITVDMAMRSTPAASFITVKSGSSLLSTLNFSPANGTYSFANTTQSTFELSNPSANSRLDLALVRGSAGATAWLNFIEFRVTRKLNFSGNYLSFRSVEKLFSGEVLKFQLSGANNSVQILDVTNPVSPLIVQQDLQGNLLSFKSLTDTLREFVAYSGGNFPSPESVGKIANQNLHALENVDMVILVHPAFLSQAERLANLHRSEGLVVEVVTPAVVYNEFSSGAADITAIKDLMKMLYNKASGDPELQPKYLLLFGDGSYINKDYPGNTNYLLTYQSDASEDLVASFVSDDYFGFLDPNEGEGTADLVDIGIGRFPVSSVEQAEQVVDKIVNYVSKGYSQGDPSPFGEWRNKVLFVADDLSGNPGGPPESVHMLQADLLASKIDTQFKPYLTDKVYMDAYKQFSTPGGERYPDAANAFRSKVQQGALIVNYTGHGGEVGLAHERVLDIGTIESWTNINALPLFVTATCEFARFDDPGRTSAGELVLLNPRGGGIGLLTTTRLVYVSPNFTLNNFFYDYALPDTLGNTMTLGEITKITKVKAAQVSGGFHNHMNFTLLGDPALRLAYPKYRVATSSINGISIGQAADTLKAFSKVKVEGQVNNLSNNLIGNFNGVVDVTVLDKADNLTTLGNDSPIYESFTLKDKVIYKGKASVVNGLFTFEFIVPRDISFAYGKGSIVYYANNGTEDGNGGYEDFVVGGVSSNPLSDNQGPAISLFINNTDFNPGDITDENPQLLAFINDESGINTTGNGVGHEILATLDANTENAVVLNNYYVADLDTYKKGKVEYPFYKLTDGGHSLTVKVWDINNNSSSATTNFLVANSASLTIENLLNYPNPVVDFTTFGFDHNQSGKELSVAIEIFDSMGRMVKLIESTINEPSNQSKSVQWDGTSDGGHTIERGIYVYRLTVKKPDGSEVSKTNRLLVLK